MKRMYDENEIKSIASESGGGKWYLHILSISDPETAQVQLRIINTDSSKITSVTDELLGRYISALASSSFPPAYSNIYNMALLGNNRLSVTTYNAYPFDVTHTTTYEIDLSQAIILDNPIEL